MAYDDYAWITDRLAIGGTVAEPDELPFDAVLSLETSARATLRDLVESGHVEYQWRSIMDGNGWETDEEVVQHFDAAAAQINDWLASGKRVLVHCFAGASRSVTAVIWYLVRYRGFNWHDALGLIRGQRSIANPNVRFEIALRRELGEDMSEHVIEERIKAFCGKMLADFEIEVDPQHIWDMLARGGASPQRASVAR
jgi:predicted protein tyrosine phosphatase